MIPAKKQKALKMIRQTMGTMKKLEQMILDDVYCIDVIQQVDSTIGMLSRAKLELLAGHLASCAEKKMKENKEKAIEELLKVYRLSTR